jgi:hypothetical protein
VTKIGHTDYLVEEMMCFIMNGMFVIKKKIDTSLTIGKKRM